MVGFWRTLHNTMLASLNSGAFLQFNGYTVAGRTFQYRSLEEFRNILDWVEEEAAKEEGKPLYKGRTYAGQGGRG